MQAAVYKYIGACMPYTGGLCLKTGMILSEQDWLHTLLH
jgi:hypothetical protein